MPGGGLSLVCKVWALADLAGRPALAQLVVGKGLVRGVFAGKGCEASFNFAPYTADGDAEHPLAALDEIDDFIRRRALVDARAVAHERDLGEVFDAALPQVFDGGADLLQGDAGVQEPFDHLENQDVAEAVEPLRAGAGRAADGGLNESGACPVVELAVGDAGRLAGGGPR